MLSRRYREAAKTRLTSKAVLEELEKSNPAKVEGWRALEANAKAERLTNQTVMEIYEVTLQKRKRGGIWPFAQCYDCLPSIQCLAKKTFSWHWSEQKGSAATKKMVCKA